MAPRSGIRVLVLGPVRVRHADGEVVPGGPRERAVLAALALAGEAGVDHDRLVDLVWGYDAPRTAHRTAQAYLSRLRGALGKAVLVTVAGRHRLIGVDVDLWEFELLVSSARRTPSTAPRDLAAALALWRDRAVAQDAALDGAVELLQAWQRSRLDARELMLAHLEDELVVTEAEELLAEAPHREKVWIALATALYRLGRQDEALAALRRARDQLAEDLGIDPSPELEHLESDLLNHRLAALSSPPVPEPITRLLGRDEEVDSLVADLDGCRLVTLVGTGGIGKTRLALAAAERISRGGTPAFVARLASVTSPVAVRDAVVEALDAGVSDLEGAVERRFGREPGLLVLDNCEHVLQASADLVSALLGRPLRLRILATSRTALGVTGERLVDVPPLQVPGPETQDDAASAVQLFLDRAADVTDTSAWGTRERLAVAEICRSLDGIPLALELAARRLRAVEVTELPGDLHAALGEPARGGDPRHASLVAAMEWSYGSLTVEQRTAFRLLGLVHGRLPLAAAAGIVGDRRVVEDLLNASLLTRTAQGLGMYEPVRQYAVSLLDPDERTLGLTRVAEEVAALAQRASGRLIGPDEVRWIERLDAVHGDLRAVWDWALANGRDDLVVQLPRDVGYLWLLGWSPAEGRRWLDVALPRATGSADRALLLVWSSCVAGRVGNGPLARAHADAAIAEARQVEDAVLLGQALHARALPDKYAADTRHARECLREAHSLRLRGGDLAGAAMSLGAVADIDVNEGHFDRAIEGYAVGLPLMRSAGTARGLVAYLHSMAELELMRGDPERAELLALDAEESAQQTGDVWHVAHLLSVRATAARDRHRPPEEQRALNRAALRAASAQADPQILLDVVEHVAGHLVDEGRYADGLRLLTGALDVRSRDSLLPSVPRRARRDADEAAARRGASTPYIDLEVDVSWLAAVAMEALG